jgi:hypothetical protein
MNTSRFRFDLATEEDDGPLRQRMAEDWMRGPLSLSFRREPSYFAACCVQGEGTQVIKCTDLSCGRIAGMGSRSLRTVFLNGRPARVGYLSDLRAHPSYRNGTLLARGYRFLRQLHYADPGENACATYFTVILDGNTTALRALTGGRAGLPAYRDLGRILTPGVHLDLPRRRLREPGLRFECARAGQLPEILEFLRRWQRQKQFAPIYSAADFGTHRLRDLRVEDFLLALRGERIVGCCAAWDQRGFRQTHIEQYSPALAAIRPVYNLAARLLPLKPLPSPGCLIPYFYLSFVAAEENDVRVFRALLREMYLERRCGPWHYFIAGLHERDPLAAALDDYRKIGAAGRLFAVHFEDGAEAFAALDRERVPYVEMATV